MLFMTLYAGDRCEDLENVEPSKPEQSSSWNGLTVNKLVDGSKSQAVQNVSQATLKNAS